MYATVTRAAVASLVALGIASAQDSAKGANNASEPARQTVAPDSTSAASPRNAVVQSDTIRFGGRVIPAGDTARGPIVVALGDLRVRGTVIGTVVAIAGDVIVEAGGHVTGDAIAAFGNVIAPSGAVLGSQRSISGTFGSVNARPVPEPVRLSTRGALNLAFGWFVIVLIIGIGVHVFAGSYLAGVTDVLEQSFWRSFLIGIVGQLGIIPALVLLLIGLAVTVVGILLIPFAIVAFVLAVAGLVTLGFLAMARLTGASIGSGRVTNLSAPGSALRGLIVGVALYLGMWIVAAAFQWSPLVSGGLRVLAFVITYVAATAGLGAAILSRGGIRRDAARSRAATGGGTGAGGGSEDVIGWQTPTPITGVVAARRPTPAASPRQRA